MTTRLLIIASFFALAVPTALAAPPADKGKPDNPGTTASASSQSAEKNAAKACKAERKQLGEAAFAARYGTNKNKRNAFGKCVSSKSKSKGNSSSKAKDDDGQDD